MYLKEESSSKLFQPTFSWSSTRGGAHTRAQLPAQESSPPCEENHVGSSPSATWQQLTPTRAPKSLRRGTASSPCPGDSPQDTRDRRFPLSPGSNIPCLRTCTGARVGNTQLPPVQRLWEQFFRYTRLLRRESKQKHVNLVQLCDSMDGQWKDAQAQLQTVGLKMCKLHVHSQGPNFSKYSSKEENYLVNQSKKPKPNQNPTEPPTCFLRST